MKKYYLICENRYMRFDDMLIPFIDIIETSPSDYIIKETEKGSIVKIKWYLEITKKQADWWRNKYQDKK